jgi:hypothetical protein
MSIGNSPPSTPAMPEMYVVPGVVVVERFFTVPLDYFNESRGTIQIFARHCVSLARQKQMDALPFMVYLQGGTVFREREREGGNAEWILTLWVCRTWNGGIISTT